MKEYIVKLVATAVVCWWALLLLVRHLFPRRSFGFCNHLVSTFHSTLAVTLAAISVQDWSCPVCPLASKSSHSQMQALAVSEAYLIYDFVCCLLDKQFSTDNTRHRMVSIVGIGAGLAYELCGSEMVATLWITEISSPCLHMRELIKELRYRDTDLNLAADIAFAVTFSVWRMIGGLIFCIKHGRQTTHSS